MFSGFYSWEVNMRVYIICPARVYTGGPTALFQLCHVLRNYYDVDAIMAFYNVRDLDPVDPNYRKFKCPWTTVSRVNDASESIIIAPETAVHFLEFFSKARKVVYWLAVDNYVLSIYARRSLGSKVKVHLHALVNSFARPSLLLSIVPYLIEPREVSLLKPHRSLMYRAILNAYFSEFVRHSIANKLVPIPNADLHIAQSIYARRFLERSGVREGDIIVLHEPLEEEYLIEAKKIDYDKKQDIIAWNPRKTYPEAVKLVSILRRRGINVVDLWNVGKDRMIKILSKTKIFIDIGIHPGRDRPPREAVALGNITIVNNHGGCYHVEDCPIPPEFKLNCYTSCKIDYKKYAEEIEYYLENFDYYIKKFEPYRHLILSEPNEYLQDTKVLVEKLTKII
jgi:hypothetical protein